MVPAPPGGAAWPLPPAARSDAFDRTERHTRSVPRRAYAGSKQQPEDAPPMARERLQELQHLLVGPTGPTDECPRHHVGEVVVAERNRIGVAERHHGHPGGAPRPHAG